MRLKKIKKCVGGLESSLDPKTHFVMLHLFKKPGRKKLSGESDSGQRGTIDCSNVVLSRRRDVTWSLIQLCCHVVSKFEVAPAIVEYFMQTDQFSLNACIRAFKDNRYMSEGDNLFREYFICLFEI